jgi:hypothetical protein
MQRVETERREEMHGIDSKLRGEIHRLREDMHGIDSSLRGEIHRLREDMQSMKAELIKWSFMFWAGAVAALSGMMFAMWRSLSSH